MRPLKLLAPLLAAALLFSQAGFAKPHLKGPFKYLSPLPDSEWISPRTQLVFRHRNARGPESWRGGLTVTGSRSGPVAGRWIAASDGQTFIFQPALEFVPGERVNVTIGRGQSGGLSYSFTIAPTLLPDAEPPQLCSCLDGALPDLPEQVWPEPPRVAPRITRNGYELPEQFPDLDITVNEGTAPGSVFIASMIFAPSETPRYLMILGRDGEPEFFRPLPARTLWDFKVQPDGRLSFFHFGTHKYYFMDDTYTVVDSVWSHNYSGTDAHDVQVLPNGSFLVIGTQQIPYDMSEVVEGGDPDALIVNMIVQEVDGDGNVVFEWRSFDHFDPLDAIGYDITGPRVDYVHTNSVELDDDGNLILSHRNIDEVTKISRDTADIIWHMGGKNNDFTLVGDTQWFSHQHSARRQQGGTLTVFDNGNNNDPRESRVVEYEVDEENLTATLVWEYRHDPAIIAFAMGNAHRQPNGNTVIGWGTGGTVTEVRPDGSTTFEMTLPRNTFSYRAFRFPWHGVAARPDIWATTYDSTLALNFTKFGDREVEAYNVYRGDAPEPDDVMVTTESNRVVVHGFEPGQTLHFRVTALDRHGNESGFSNEIAVTPEFGDELLAANVRVTPRTLNLGSQGRWIDARVGFPEGCGCGASATVENVVLNGTVAADQVQVAASGGDIDGLKLKFPRGAVAALLEPGDNVAVTVSGQIGERAFVATDMIRVIDPGGEGDMAGEEPPVDDVAPAGLGTILPNPFNPTTVIHYRAVSGRHVTIDIFDVTGRRLRTLVDGPVSGGESSVTWDGRDHSGRALASGIYFCRLRSGGVVETRKMLLVK